MIERYRCEVDPDDGRPSFYDMEDDGGAATMPACDVVRELNRLTAIEARWTRPVDTVAERDKFEHRAFAQYFISGIRRNPSPPQPKISGALDFVPDPHGKNKAEFCARNDQGHYVEESLNPAWWAWLESAKEAR